MNNIKISDYVTNGKGTNGDIEKTLKAEMDKLDDLKQPWSITIDIDWPLNDVWTMYIKDNGYPHGDYEYLDSIDVTKNVCDFKSINGCLVNKDDELVFAPKNKRTKSISVKAGFKGINIDLMVWNEVSSKALRTNISEFASKNYYNDPYKEYFEELLLLYKKNIYEDIFGKSFLKNSHMPGSNLRRVSSDDIFIDKITLSPMIKYKKFDLNNIEIKEDHYDERELDYSNNYKKEDDNGEYDIYAPFSILVYGEYFQKDHEVVLYVEAMKKSGKTGRDLEDLFLSVLIHEFFHAVHHTYCDKYGNRNPFKDNNDIIVESLAASFEYYFCDKVLSNDILTSEMIDMWKKHSVFVYPYSGAKEILSLEHSKGYHELEKKLQDIKRNIKTSSSKKEYLSDLQYFLHDSEYKIHIISYFELSLISMDMAQIDLLSRCL
ncbi:MAG: hypothetical protein K6G26_02375 [Lachnospiraceae bacterium]|nr:hypothetical protein [Lachnospiraceae bacterium]